MADVKFTAFVEDIHLNQDGYPFAINTSEAHRRQVDGEWTTEARTFREVKTSRTSGVELTGLRKGDRITVTGSEKTEKYTSKGEARYKLVVWADAITPVSSGNAASQPVAEQPEAWGTMPDSDLPF